MSYAKSNYYTIYAYVAPDGRRYIGKTGSQQNERAGNGGAGYKHCGCFWKAINRYGWNSFRYEPLAVVSKALPNAAERACELEAFYISKFRTTNIRFGFNRFKKDSPRSYEKLSKSRLNRRVINKDGVIKQVVAGDYDAYIQNGWSPGYNRTS